MKLTSYSKKRSSGKPVQNSTLDSTESPQQGYQRADFYICSQGYAHGSSRSVKISVRDLSAEETRIYDKIMIPISNQMNLSGLLPTTIDEVFRIVRKVLISHGVSGVARMITRWNICTRIILSDEDHTRFADPVPGSLYAKTARNSVHLYSRLDNIPCRSFRLSQFEKVIIHQGSRGIPPYLLDPRCLPGLLPNPSYEEKRVLVDLSNLKRTLPEGDGPAVLKALTTFKYHVERSVQPFNLRKLSSKLCFLYRKSKSSKTRIDLSFHGSLGYSRGKGGKTQEFIDKVINGFLEMPCCELFPEPPMGDLFDYTGNLVMRPIDWDPDARLAEVLYPDIGVYENLDDRLGHIALLWALCAVRQEEKVDIIVDDEFYSSGCSYSCPAVVRFIDGILSCRVSPQPEEGFKVRVITITSLAVSIIGAAARHFLDEHLWSSDEIKIGLLSRVKLYALLDHIGGKRAGAYDKTNKNVINFCPYHAESVDLTCATDTPPRQHAQDILKGHLDCMQHSAEPFLRFAVDLATSEREFILDPNNGNGPCPIIHNCGFMMGEGLTGIFLNDSSALIRSIAPKLYVLFPELRVRKVMSNLQAQEFVDRHRVLIQSFFDTVHVDPNRAGSQSGDDVINFSNESLSVAFRVIYIAWGFVPSETTWFSSDKYCTFTEEAAIRTHDSGGWKFVDSIKPRVFAVPGDDPDGNVLVSHMKLLGSYVRYFDKTDIRRSRAITMAGSMIDSRQVWKRVIRDNDIPIGWPEFLGGIQHPCGLEDDYNLSQSIDNLSIIKGLLSLDPIEAFSELYSVQTEEGDEGFEELEEKIREVIRTIMILPRYDVFVENMDSAIFDVADIVPKANNWWMTLKGYDNFRKENDLVSVSDFIDALSSRLKLQLILKGQERQSSKKAWTLCKNRINRLRARFPSTQYAPTLDEISELSVWKIKETIMNRVRQSAISRTTMDSLLEGITLPFLGLNYLTEGKEVDLGKESPKKKRNRLL